MLNPEHGTLVSETPTHSVLYDVENDTFSCFIQDYHEDINVAFNINHIPIGKKMDVMSFAIDNDNHILY